MNKYREPAAKKKKTTSFESAQRTSIRNNGADTTETEGKAAVKKIRINHRDSLDSLSAFDTVRAIRQSTKEKTVDSDVARKKAFKIKIKSRPPLRHQFSQKELLLDALETEVSNEYQYSQKPTATGCSEVIMRIIHCY